MREFTGKTAVVTGGASGIGRAIVDELAQLGMRIVIADIEEATLDAEVARLRAGGHDVVGVVTDVSRFDAMTALADAARDAFGPVHLLCNNAGVEGYYGGAIWDATDKDWAWTFGVNLWGAVNGVRAFLPGMLAHGEVGHIVNTVSMTALVKPGSMYGITKHAVLAMTEVVHGDLASAQAHIGISALCPGTIATRLFTGSRNRPANLTDEVDNASTAEGRKVREMMNARLAGGLDPAVVAARMVDGVRRGELYILTDGDWHSRVEERANTILAASRAASARGLADNES